MIRSFIVHGDPVPWSVMPTGRGRGYKPRKLREYQERVYMEARGALAEREADNPLRLDITICFERPKSRSKDRPAQFIPYDIRPDRDNVTKAIQDALGRPPDDLLPIFTDDRRVFVGETIKVWNPVGVPSFVIVSIEFDLTDAEAELERIGTLDIARAIAGDAIQERML